MTRSAAPQQRETKRGSGRSGCCQRWGEGYSSGEDYSDYKDYFNNWNIFNYGCGRGVYVSRVAGGRLLRQRGVQLPPANCTSPDTKFKRATKVWRQPLAALPPADKNVMSCYLLHQDFGRWLADILILRCAKLALGLNTANLPMKLPVISLAGRIYPIFNAEAFKSYTDSSIEKQVPSFEQPEKMKILEGYVRSNPYFWYRPWAKADYPVTH